MFVLTTEQITKACEYSNCAAFSFFFFSAAVEMFAHNKEPGRSRELRTCWREEEAATGEENQTVGRPNRARINNDPDPSLIGVIFVNTQHLTLPSPHPVTQGGNNRRCDGTRIPL